MLAPVVMWMSLLASAQEPAVPAAPADAAPPTQLAPAAPAAAAPVQPLVRTYAMRQKFVSQMKDPNPFNSTGWRSTHTYTWALVEWRQLGDRVDYKERTCGVWTESVFGARTVYRDAFVNAVPVRDRSGYLQGEGAARRFDAGPYSQQFGLTLDDPFNDALPTAPDDARISDDDRDGHPGVTVGIYHPMVGEGEVYIAQRSIVRLEGELLPDGIVHGYIRTKPDMYKIDADKWWLRMDNPQRPHPDPKESPFVMVPIEKGATCKTVLAQKDTIFEGKEPDPNVAMAGR